MTITLEEQKEEEIVVEGEGSRRQKRFLTPFYDATTGKLMKDPVVDPAGDSFEKSTLTGTSASMYYPNRALKTIIQSEVELASKTWKGSVRRLDQAMQSGWGKLLEKSAFGVEYRPLPESFYCPITCELITDPVISKYGISYEHEAIENWIRVNGKSPMTRDPLTMTDLRDNNALYELIQIEKGRTLESVHPSIRRWKESGDPTSRRTVRPPHLSASAPPAAMDLPVIVPPGTTTPYPTTEAGIEARRRERQHTNWTLAVVCFTLVVLFMAFPYFFGILLFICMATCPVWCCCCFLYRGQSSDDEDE